MDITTQLEYDELDRKERQEIEEGLLELRKKGMNFERFKQVLNHWLYIERNFHEDDYVSAYNDYAHLYSKYTLSVKDWCHDIAYCDRTLNEHGHCLKSNLIN